MVDHDHLDIDLCTQAMLEHPGTTSVALVDAVANRRLFVLNGKGEYEEVVLVTYWKNDRLLSVCSDGYEFDENGEVTRDWRENGEDK